MPVFYSPTGNPEVWNEKPKLYYTPEEWGALHPAPTPTFDELKAQKKAEIAAMRFEKETSGITVFGATIDTDRDSQALITGAALAAVIDSGYSLNWKTESGFVHLTAPEILAIAQAVRAHVQACFDREAELVALVDAAETAEELDAIDMTWTV